MSVRTKLHLGQHSVELEATDTYVALVTHVWLGLGHVQNRRQSDGRC